MNTKRKSHLKKKSIIIFLICAVLFAAAFLTAYFTLLQKPAEAQKENKEAYKTIAVPGYEGLSLKADSAYQTLRLKNPGENDCYFIIELYLNDGTLLWKSDYIKPGEASRPVKLNTPLKAGTYNECILKYSCFKTDSEKTPLNGAETKLTLRVK